MNNKELVDLRIEASKLQEGESLVAIYNEENRWYIVIGIKQGFINWIIDKEVLLSLYHLLKAEKDTGVYVLDTEINGVELTKDNSLSFYLSLNKEMFPVTVAELNSMYEILEQKIESGELI